MKVDTSIGCPVEFYVGICCLIFKYKPIMSFLRRLKIMSQITLVALFLPRSNSIFVLYSYVGPKSQSTTTCQRINANAQCSWRPFSFFTSTLRCFTPSFFYVRYLLSQNGLVVSIATSLLAIQSRLTRSDCP